MPTHRAATTEASAACLTIRVVMLRVGASHQPCRAGLAERSGRAVLLLIVGDAMLWLTGLTDEATLQLQTHVFRQARRGRRSANQGLQLRADDLRACGFSESACWCSSLCDTHPRDSPIARDRFRKLVPGQERGGRCGVRNRGRIEHSI